MIETPLEKVIGRAALFDLSHLGANARCDRGRADARGHGPGRG
jgi:hypothetical protein